jgi:hypothetical protein
MGFHKQKRPDIDWSKVNVVDCRTSYFPQSGMYPYNDYVEPPKPDEHQFEKDVVKLIDKYGLERVYDRIREMHYDLECHGSKMRLEQFLKEEGAK